MNESKDKGSSSSNQKPSHTKYMGLFLIIGSLTLLGIWLAYDFIPSLDQNSKTVQIKSDKKKSGLQKLWEEDIQAMLEEKKFNVGISSIRKVRVFMLDENLHAQLKYLRAPFKQKRNGQNLLEVSFMSHHSDAENTEKIVVQYNLTDKDSGNMFWEHSRTITIPDKMLAN